MSTVGLALAKALVKDTLAGMSIEELQYIQLLMSIDTTISIIEAIEIVLKRRG